MPNALSDRHLLTLVAAILHGADTVASEVARAGYQVGGEPGRASDIANTPVGDTVQDARHLIALVAAALVSEARPANTAADDAALTRLILSPERLDRMLDDALTAYEASLAATLDSFGSLDRGDRRTAMRAALAAALWGAPP